MRRPGTVGAVACLLAVVLLVVGGTLNPAAAPIAILGGAAGIRAMREWSSLMTGTPQAWLGVTAVSAAAVTLVALLVGRTLFVLTQGLAMALVGVAIWGVGEHRATRRRAQLLRRRWAAHAPARPGESHAIVRPASPAPQPWVDAPELADAGPLAVTADAGDLTIMLWPGVEEDAEDPAEPWTSEL